MPEQILTKTHGSTRTLHLSDGRALSFTRPLVMGVLNVTPDSFSDGGQFLFVEKAVERALQMESEGADIIDIGGESSRPGAEPIDAEEEKKRVLPVISALRRQSQIPISIDTYKASTAAAAFDTGADIINDISALRFDSAMGPLAASHGVPVILMHMLGTPRDMQINPIYENCVEEITNFFKERIAHCQQIGIDKNKLILDPGIGFGKRLEDNLDILAHIEQFQSLGLPVLIGASRKSFINMLHPRQKAPTKRLGGSLAAAIMALVKGADIIRVHDVEETVEALAVLQAIKDRT